MFMDAGTLSTCSFDSPALFTAAVNQAGLAREDLTLAHRVCPKHALVRLSHAFGRGDRHAVCQYLGLPCRPAQAASLLSRRRSQDDTPADTAVKGADASCGRSHS